MTFAGCSVQIVADKVASVLDLLLSWLQDERIGGLDVVVDDVVGQDTALALRQEEKREFLVLLALTS